MKASAVKHGDSYIINGTKLWITNAEHAGVFAVFVNANPTQVSHANPINSCELWLNILAWNALKTVFQVLSR